MGEAQAERPPERATGAIHYATQVSAGPPTFVLFGSREPSAGHSPRQVAVA